MPYKHINRFIQRERYVKPKTNRKSGPLDSCQTPPYALEPLIPYLNAPIWECAAGNRTLSTSLKNKRFSVLDTDITDNPSWDFFSNGLLFPTFDYVIVTNPPYSIKYDWLQRCYYLGYPFALLMPVEMLGTAKGQKLFERYGIEIIFMSPRVDFYMPNKGYEGAGAQFPTAWFTWKLGLPNEINFAQLNKPKRSELKEYWEKALGLTGQID